MSNVHEELARSRKVAALVDKLRAAHISADLAELLDPEDWAAAAKQAGVNAPGKSGETQAAVIAHLRAGEGR